MSKFCAASMRGSRPRFHAPVPSDAPGTGLPSPPRPTAAFARRSGERANRRGDERSVSRVRHELAGDARRIYVVQRRRSGRLMRAWPRIDAVASTVTSRRAFCDRGEVGRASASEVACRSSRPEGTRAARGDSGPHRRRRRRRAPRRARRRASLVLPCAPRAGGAAARSGSEHVVQELNPRSDTEP